MNLGPSVSDTGPRPMMFKPAGRAALLSTIALNSTSVAHVLKSLAAMQIWSFTRIEENEAEELGR